MATKMYPVVSICDGQPTFEVELSLILAECEQGGAIKVLSPTEFHTDRQRRWYRGICLKGLSDWNGDTVEEWDARLKALCGAGLLKKEVVPFSNGMTIQRLTIVGVGKKNMTAFIENILSKAIEMEWCVTPPDESLRS